MVRLAFGISICWHDAQYFRMVTDYANPPAKKRRTKKGSVGIEGGRSKPRQRQPKVGKLAGIMEMPIDIFSEVSMPTCVVLLWG